MSRKTIYYHDPLHDDFAPTNGHIRPKPIGADFPYEHPSPVWQALAFVVYRLIMTPFLFLYCKLVFGLRIENRKALRELPSGYFLYGNHTNTLADAFIPTLLAFPRRANIVTAADTVSIPGVRNIVQMLGAVPLADTIDGTRQFLAAIHRRLERRQAVMIYPEAHIWPYYNGIRPFPDTAFAYPVREQVPAVGVVVVYRQRKLLRFLPPCITVVVGEPVYPDASLPPRSARRALHQKVYTFMCDTVARRHSYAHIEYLPAQDTQPAAQCPRRTTRKVGSRLAHLTEAAIQDAFLKLLSEQPFDKITVTQLVEECQITRRTFYYHYSDLYELLDTILRRETERALDEFETTGSWEECMITASRFAREHKRAVYHIYTSSHRLELEKHVDRISGEMMRSYVEAQAHGLRVSEADKKLVCDLYRFGITDIFYEWLENGMKEDLEAQIRRLSLLFTGNIRASLSRVQIPAES